MLKKKDCPFCGNNRKKFLRLYKYDVEKMYFYENKDFSISPDLSPLVTGHLLIIPTKHHASFGEISNTNMLVDIRQKSEELLGTKDLLYFEHGAVLEGEGGASIDHAHLHVMPRPKDLSVDMIDDYIQQTGKIQSEKMVASHQLLQKLYKNRQPYIYYQIGDCEYAYPVNNIPHQFLRLMLQNYSLLSYDWRQTFNTEECRHNVESTIKFVNNIKIK